MKKLIVLLVLSFGLLGFAQAESNAVADVVAVQVTDIVDEVTGPMEPLAVEVADETIEEDKGEGKGEKTFNMLYAVIAFLFSTFAAGHLANFFEIKKDDAPWLKFIKKIVNLWGTNWSHKAGK